MFPDWITTAGFVLVIGYVGVRIYMRCTTGKDFVSPWEAYQRALSDAQAARGQFLRKGLLETIKSLKDRICCQVQKWHIPLCPLCC
jgi:hypothetical protein